MTLGVRDVQLKSRSRVAEQGFLPEGMDRVYLAMEDSPKQLVEIQFIKLLPFLGRNLFTCAIAAQGVTWLNELGAFGSAECLSYGNRILAASLNLASLVYTCNKIVPSVYKLYAYSRSLQRRVLTHAASFFSVFNGVPTPGKPCPFLYEEIILLSQEKLSSHLERLKLLVRMTGPGYHLKSASILFESSLRKLSNVVIAEKRLMGTLNMLMEYARTRDQSLPLVVPDRDAFSDLVLLTLKTLIALRGPALEDVLQSCLEARALGSIQNFVAFEIAQHFESCEERQRALELYMMVLRFKPPAEVTIDSAYMYTYSYSLLRVAEIWGSRTLMTQTIKFLRSCESMYGPSLDQNLKDLLTRATASWSEL